LFGLSSQFELAVGSPLAVLQSFNPPTTIMKGNNWTSWRFKATCGHVKQTAKALARRLRAGFFYRQSPSGDLSMYDR
jgi:hypothetical protein